MLDYYLKTAVKSVSSPIADRLGLFDRRAKANAPPWGSWLIPMYHRVIDDPDEDPFHLGMCVNKEHFRAQILFFSRHYRASRLDFVMRHIVNGDAPPTNTVALTFDDGYLDNYSMANSILEKYNIPWTLFVTTGQLENGEGFWWDKVIDVLATARKPKLDLNDVGLSNESNVVSLDWIRRRQSVVQILNRFWELPHSEIDDRISRLRALLRSSSGRHVTGGQRIKPDQLISLHRKGVEIAAHTVNHPNLMLMDRHQIINEMTQSKAYLEELLQTEVAGFAFPAGRENALVIECARAVGFRYVAGTKSAYNVAPYQSWSLRRVGMPDVGIADLKRALSKLSW